MSDERKQKTTPPRKTSKSKGRGSNLRSLIVGVVLIAAIFLFILSPAFNTGDAVRAVGQFGTDVGNVISEWINNIFNAPPITVDPDGDVNLGNG